MRLDHERVRWHRDRLGWTLDTLAEKAEVAKGTVLRAEHGEDVRPSSGRRIAKALGTEISELIPDKPERVGELAAPLTKAPREAGPKDEETPGTLIHAEVLKEIANLWDEQLSRRLYDETTLQKMYTAGFLLAMNHEGSISEEDRESLTPNFLEQLEAAEERLVAVGSRIWETLEKTSRGYTAPPDELAAKREELRQKMGVGKHARNA